MQSSPYGADRRLHHLVVRRGIILQKTSRASGVDEKITRHSSIFSRQGRHFTQAPQVPLGIAEFGSEEYFAMSVKIATLYILAARDASQLLLNEYGPSLAITPQKPQ